MPKSKTLGDVLAPELRKQRQSVQEFLDWLATEKDIYPFKIDDRGPVDSGKDHMAALFDEYYGPESKPSE